MKITPIHYFSNIPNNEEGAEFIRLARKFLNRKRYKMRKLGRGTRKVNGAKNSYRYSASLPHQFSERFSLYIDDRLHPLSMTMDEAQKKWALERKFEYLKEVLNGKN
tara:strand:- start:266 stop:586 length:321 start_codon:yes stop_codon:yes gene_type:complete